MLISLEMLHKKYNLNIKGIIHFGAHLAEETEVYNKINAEHVIWFEANPKLADLARVNAQPFIRHTIYNELMSDTDGEEMTFYITNNGQSSSMLKLARHASYYPEITVTDTIQLKTKRFDTFAREHDIDTTRYNFLNLDVQGAELKVIHGFDGILRHVDYIYTEVNTEELYQGCALLEEIDAYLAPYGFKRKELVMTDKSWGDAFYVKEGMKTQIVMHVMPHEMIQYDRCMKSLVNCMGQFDSLDMHIDHRNELELYVTLNLSPALTDWDHSSVKPNDVTKTFEVCTNQIRETRRIVVKTDIITNDSILGTTAQKRKAIRQADSSIKNFIFLDSDIYFHWSTLKYLFEATRYVNNEYYIITPQTVKLWDETWDVITNEKFINEPYGFHKTFEPSGIETIDFRSIDAQITPVPTFKFGCGWFTLYSANLWKFVDIPDGLGAYGSEDTYLMFACMMMKERGIDVQQYMLEGLYICEDFKYRPQSYEGQIVRKTTKEDNYVKHNTPQFSELMKQFEQRLMKR